MKKHIFLFLLIAFSLTSSAADNNENFHLSSAVVTPRALNYIKENYIDQSRVVPFEMLKGALNQIQKSAAEILVTFDQGYKFSVTIDKATKKFNPTEMKTVQDLWSVLREVYTFIELNYHGSIKQNDIEYLAIDGMLEKLDPHSNMLTPKIYNEFKIGTKGKFGGIGIVIGSREGNLTVISPIEDTPAWRAGIKAGDKITQIGEESTVNMSLTEAVEQLRGDVGTNVTITIERKGRAVPFNVTLKRAVIKIESIQSTSIPVDGRTVGYIKIKNFQEDTDKEFTKQLTKIKESPKFSGLIIDLRNDPGGLLNQAVEIVDKFISDGVIVSTVGAGNKFIEQEVANGKGTEPPYPLIVIVNEGSASASEIVAGTLQSYRRAIVIGSQTFGKGSVQTVYDLRDGSGLKLTIAEYLTAGKNSLQSVGVVPDIRLIPARVDKKGMDIFEDKHETEESLEGHLSKYSETLSKDSTYKLNFFQPVEKENEEEATKREYSNKLDFSKDFAVQFASKIMASAPTDTYEDLLKSALPVISEVQKEEESKIENALKKIGIDWSDCKPSGKPVLQVGFALQKNNEVIAQATAGEDVDLVLNAKNIGTGPFCRLTGNSDAKEYILKNKEFVFGRIDPAVEIKAVVPFKVVKNLISENMPFTVKFSEENGNKPSEFKAIVPIKGLPQPQFAYTFKLGQPANVKVQEEPMPIGKTIPIVMNIKNVGKGAALNAFATIKNVEAKGVFIDTGRVKIGKLEPGQTKQITFKFRIASPLPKSVFELELTIADQDLLTLLTKKIEFNASTGATTPPTNVWYEGPKISFENVHFPISTTAAKHHIEGSISDEQEVKDYMIFVGDDKVAYSSNPDQTSKYQISADIPLKDGNNIVSVIARDVLDQSTRSTFVIEKK